MYVVILFSFFISLLSYSLEDLSQMKFQWQSSDGTLQLDCDHWQMDTTRPDWEVLCGKKTLLEKRYTVHLVVRKHQGSQKNTNFEIMYWVIDQQSKDSGHFKSTTHWLEFDKDVKLQKLKISLGIENDYAQLTLTLNAQDLFSSIKNLKR